jgi:hypothetical protein
MYQVITISFTIINDKMWRIYGLRSCFEILELSFKKFRHLV